MFSRSCRQSSPRRRSSQQVRPQVEAVEPRLLMATASYPLVVATLGDSLTDEYSFYGPDLLASLGSAAAAFPLPAAAGTVGRSAARNWVLNLATTRAAEVSFGQYSVASRGETRNQGFAEDWARSGATAKGANLDGTATTFAEQLTGSRQQSLPGLLTQTVANSGFKAGRVNVVTIAIGSNDYLRALTTYATSLSADDEFAARSGHTNSVNAGIEASIRSAVVQIHRKIPRARIVIATPPDITTAPVVATALAAGSATFPGLGGIVTRSLTTLNTDLARFAQPGRLGVVNTQTLLARFRTAPTVNGVTVDLQASGQDVADGFVGDGFHPGSILQGLLAQAIVGRINALYGKNVIAPLTDTEIADYANATQPTVLLNAELGKGLTLRAVVTPGPGNTTIPSGTVTFETITAATATTPAKPGIVLGVAPVDDQGVATLVVSPSFLDIGPFYAVYSGDEANDARISPATAPVFSSAAATIF